MNTRLILSFALLFASVIALYCSFLLTLSKRRKRQEAQKAEEPQLENN